MFSSTPVALAKNPFNLTFIQRNDPRFESIIEHVKTKGLADLYHHLKKYAIGTDVFISIEDWHYLALLDGQVKPHLKVNEKQSAELSISKSVKYHEVVKEKDGQGMRYFEDINFQSWEETINVRPKLTFMPKSKTGLQNLVKWANTEKKRLRACGYRHSSSPVYTDDQEIMVAMVDIETATTLPAQYPKIDSNNDLQGIELVGEPYLVDGKKKIKCKVGPSTCNYHFVDWAHDKNGGNFQWTLPLNVIMTEISFGGSNATICHGAGINHLTLSDLVKEIEFVNAKGELQKINDPELLKAAAGAFGLLGLLTSITFELDEMTYANFKTTEKTLIANILPPNTVLNSDTLNHIGKKNVKALQNKENLKKAFERFIDRAQKNYYAEWFWFPLQKKGWSNCWSNNGDPKQFVRYPDKIMADLQRVGSYLAYLSLNTLGDHRILREIETKLTGKLAMKMLPNKQDIVCTLQDALHFRKGIQNFKARMMEVELPLPDTKDGTGIQWDICQEAWWAVIESVYSNKNMNNLPMRTTLEMRIMGGSNILMAAQYQNKRTCSIEILTPVVVNKEIWETFLQEILDKWSKLKDQNGKFLNLRPHWAKRFDNLYINREISWIDEWDQEQKNTLKQYINPVQKTVSMPIRIYLKHIAYREELKQFVNILKQIAMKGGYTYQAMKERFSNDFFDDLLKESEHNDVALSPLTFFSPPNLKGDSINSVQTRKFMQ